MVSQTMAVPIFPSLLLLLSLSYTSAADSTTAAATFIRESCGNTSYPALCVQSLSVYAPAIRRSPRQLAHTALCVSLSRARSTSAFVRKLTKFKSLKPREYDAVRDCLEEVVDSVDRLGDSVRELKLTGKTRSPDFFWHLSNVQTWVSAALTDDETCMDGFSGRVLDGRVKTSIRTRFTNVAHVTSNALALINNFAAKY